MADRHPRESDGWITAILALAAIGTFAALLLNGVIG